MGADADADACAVLWLGRADDDDLEQPGNRNKMMAMGLEVEGKRHKSVQGGVLVCDLPIENAAFKVCRLLVSCCRRRRVVCFRYQDGGGIGGPG